MAVFDDFIKGLKSDVRRFVQDHAPTGWWTDIHDLYQKALDYEVNGLASGRFRERSPERTNHANASRSSNSDEHRYAGKKRKVTPSDVGGTLPPPRRAEVQGLALARLALGAGAKSLVCGSPKRRSQPERHTRCTSGVPRKGTWARIAQMRRQPGHLLSAGCRKGEPTPCSWL